MRTRWRAVVGMAAALAAAACGGAGTPGGSPADAGKRGAAPMETRWLRGLWAKDIETALATVALPCKGPRQENRTNVWVCEAGTPLVGYRVLYYGSAPGKIEYVNAVVTQSGSAKDAFPLRLFVVLAGLRFDRADAARARKWVQAAIADGGTTEIGPAKYKLAGDANRRVLDIKASGSEW